MKQDYVVTWSITLKEDEDRHVEVAEKAFSIINEKGTDATIFSVQVCQPNGKLSEPVYVDVDLAEQVEGRKMKQFTDKIQSYDVESHVSDLSLKIPVDSIELRPSDLAELVAKSRAALLLSGADEIKTFQTVIRSLSYRDDIYQHTRLDDCWLGPCLIVTQDSVCLEWSDSSNSFWIYLNKNFENN